MHRLPTRIKQGNITLKRGVITRQGAVQWYQKTVVQAQPVTSSITLMDTTGKPDPDLELPQRLPGQVDGLATSTPAAPSS